MTSFESTQSPLTSKSSPSSSPSQLYTSTRRQSTTPSQPSAALASPRVQLVPHSRSSSYDGSISSSDMELLANTNFDSKDMSSRDFDFEDVFTYDKPQRKLKSVVEVSSPTREWSSFSFSHYPSAVATRQKYNARMKWTTSELYVRNQEDARKR